MGSAVPGEDAASAATAVSSGDALTLTILLYSGGFREFWADPPSFRWGRKKEGHDKRFFAPAVSARCLTELPLREKLGFVIFLPTGLYAVNIFFLSGCCSFTGERQLWSVDRINPKRRGIHGDSVYSCMLHV